MNERLQERPAEADPTRNRKPPAEVVRAVGRELEAAMATREPDAPVFTPSERSGEAFLEAFKGRFSTIAGLEAVHARDEAAVWRFTDGESTAILIHEQSEERSDHTEVIIIRPLAEGEFGPGEPTHVRLKYGVFHDPSEGHDGEAFVEDFATFGTLDSRGRFQWAHPGEEALGPDAPEELQASNLHDAQPSEEGGDWGATVAELDSARELVARLAGTSAE
jgi:hypothetical protein